MSKRQITLLLDERLYDALSRRLEGEKLEDKLGKYLNELTNQLPDRELEKIGREIREERQREMRIMEGPRPVSVFRVTQNGQTNCLLAEDDASMDAYHTALRLRSYLLSKSSSAEWFIQAIPSATDVAPEVFQEYADEFRQGTRCLTAAIGIDLDRGEFSVLDKEHGWKVYAIRDVSAAAWHTSQKEELEWEQRLDVFAAELEGRSVRCEAPEVKPSTGPMM